MLKQMNETLNFIEEHLTDEFVLQKAIAHTGISDVHLKKVFFSLTNMTLTEYVRNRRLSEANYDLMQGEKVTDVAFKYNYQSLDGFSRAFKNWSGILPSDVSRQGACKVFPKFNFVVTVRGGDRMECKIVQKPAFYFAGVSKRVPLQFEGVNHEIVKLAQSITPAQREEMHRVRNVEPVEIVNVSYESDTAFMKEEGYLTHMIGVLTSREDVQEGLETILMEAQTWAVFPNEGPFPFTLQNTMARIYSEWLMTSGYELTSSLSFSFTKMDNEKKDHAYSEIWIPVVKSAK